MKTPLLLLGAFLFPSTYTLAQVVPGESTGDLGWILHDQDTVILVRAADGHAWFQQNLGAAEVATAANAADSYGDLYQWGRWEDGHQSRTSATEPVSTLPANDPSGLDTGFPFFFIGTNPEDWWGAGSSADTWQGSTATATNGIDPCAAIGPNWQLPTQADWMSLLAAEEITSAAEALASNLKLPSAGSREGQNGTIINAGLYGNYWSSTANGPYAKDLAIGDGFVNADDDAYRSYGMCVRCFNKSLHTGLQEPTHEKRLSLFPNPCNGVFTLRSDIPIHSVEVFDAMSHLVRSERGSGTLTIISLTDLPTGVYAVRVGTSAGSYQERLVIAR